MVENNVFRGRSTEEPNKHITKFIQICDKANFMHRLCGEKHYILLGLTQFLSQVCDGIARSRKSWRKRTSEGMKEKWAELKEKEARRRESIAEGNKVYLYLAGPHFNAYK